MDISGLFKKLCYDLILTFFLFYFSNSFLKLAVSIKAFELFFFFFFQKNLFALTYLLFQHFILFGSLLAKTSLLITNERSLMGSSTNIM